MKDLTLVEFQALAEVTLEILEETRIEAQALRQILTEQGKLDEKALEARIEKIRTEGSEALRREVLRGADSIVDASGGDEKPN